MGRGHVPRWLRAAGLCVVAVVCLGVPVHAQTPTQADPAPDTGAPVRLRQPAATPIPLVDRSPAYASEQSPPPVYRPSEFEIFVRRLAGQAADGDAEPRRLGSELFVEARAAAVDQVPQVPADYLIGPGDEVVLAVWGNVEADLRLVVDRTGRISIPRVGAVTVAGVRYSELANTIQQRFAQQFRNFQLSATLGQLRDIRIYITGQVPRPGAYTVSSLSTVVHAVMRAGGPSAAGSMRAVELRRGGRLISTVDLYALLLQGDKSADRILQADDVVHVSGVGTQIGVIGSVNRPAVLELKAGETVEDALRMVGGFSAVAERSRLAIERLEDRLGTRVAELKLPADLGVQPRVGDVLRAYSAVSVVLAQDRQNRRVRIEGEVSRPGEYILPAGSTLDDALRAAGGLRPDAFLYGTEFNRDSVRRTQQENYDRALRDLEIEVSRASSTQRALNADEATTQAARALASSRLIQQLRAARPTGRVVLQLEPNSKELPALLLEDGDRLYIPATPTSVGVFGSVYNAGNFLYGDNRPVTDYLRLAGGPTKGADFSSVFVIRANGTVVSAQQRGNWWAASIDGVKTEPGDTVFVPEMLNKSTFTQEAKEWTQILYQFGLGAAALKTLRGN